MKIGSISAMLGAVAALCAPLALHAQAKKPAAAPTKAAPASRPRQVPIELKAGEAQLEKAGGTFLVPVLINSVLTLKFTLDSGASDVLIPADVFSTLIRTGTIRDADLIGNKTYKLADGSKLNSPTFRLRTVSVGGITLENVLASVADTEGSLLLGQSFLSRFGSWSVDNKRHVLILNGGGNGPPASAATIARVNDAERLRACQDLVTEFPGAHWDGNNCILGPRKGSLASTQPAPPEVDGDVQAGWSIQCRDGVVQTYAPGIGAYCVAHGGIAGVMQ